MNIIIDAMGGDNAPLAPMQGAALAVKELGVHVIAVGDEKQVLAAMRQHNIPEDGITVVHAPDVIGMDEDATDVLRKKPESSLSVAMKMLAAGDGDALVSAGATGALLVGATMIAKRIKGIKRAAIGTVMPGTEKPWLLIDCGANVECRAEQLVQFAVMGSAYMEKVMGIKNPSVALANNGTEDTKGTQLQLDTFPLLQQSGLNFTGNIILKLVEGVAKMMSGMIKDMIYSSTKTKIAGLLLKDGMAGFKKKLDYTEYGGAPLLGIKKPVIKAHGSSNAVAIKNAIRQAKTCAEKDVSGAIEDWIAQHKPEKDEAADD